MEPLDHVIHNRQAWDRLAKSGNRFARPASEKDLQKPLASVDGPGWLGTSIAGKKVLCLAAGGGRQGPLYAAAGADVTVVDISREMLMIDQQVSVKFELNLRTIATSMDDLSMLGNAAFDIVIQPVSTCYLPELGKLFREVARVMVAQGIYVSQHKQPTSLQTSISPTVTGYVIEHPAEYSKALPQTETVNLVREPGTMEYVHSLQAVIGGMCRSGFSIEDLIEPRHADADAEPGSFGHRSRYVSPYMRIKAKRHGSIDVSERIWSP